MPRPALALLAAAALLAACRGSAPAAATATERAGSGSVAAAEVRAALDALADELAARGPLAWVDGFGADFRMASDGAVRLASQGAARAAMEAFAPTVASMELARRDPAVDAWAPDLVGFGADDDERIVLVDGPPLAFAGHATGVWRRAPGGWRLARLHGSSPVPEGE